MSGENSVAELGAVLQQLSLSVYHLAEQQPVRPCTAFCHCVFFRLT